LHTLEKLLLNLEPESVFLADTGLNELDDDLATKVGLGLEPALLSEVGLGEASGPKLDGKTTGVEYEGIGA
jgi:hypothetical protein